MIVDTSAVMAIIMNEPRADLIADVIAGEPGAKISSATLVELYIVADSRRGPAGRKYLDEYLSEMELEVVPFTAEHADLARLAHQRYGRGSGSKARLNLGDCYSYALAAATGEPLLFVGEDFTHTDIRPALPAS